MSPNLRPLLLVTAFASLTLSAFGFLLGGSRPFGDAIWFSTTENFVHVTIALVVFVAAQTLPTRGQIWTIVGFGAIALIYGVATVALFAVRGQLLTSPADILLHFVIGFGALALASNRLLRPQSL